MTLPASSARILIADDDPVMRETLMRYLRTEGYACCGVPDAESTLETLLREEFDLLVADINMPGNASLELIRKLPRIAPGLPVILLTGNPTVETAVSSVRLPVSAYLVKPPDLGELRALVHEAISNHRIYRSTRRQWEQLESLSKEAIRHLAAHPAGSLETEETETQRNILSALEELSRVGVSVDSAAAHQLGRHAEMV